MVTDLAEGRKLKLAQQGGKPGSRAPGSLEFGTPDTEEVRGPKAGELAVSLCQKLLDPGSPLSVLAPK